jgi:hypothetical protein
VTNRKRTAVAIAAVVAAGALVASALGLDTSAGELANSIAVNTINTNVDAIKLRTKEPVRIRDVHTVSTAASGTVIANWHTHPGPILVAVKRGTLLLTQGSCTATAVGPNQAFIEEPEVPVLAVKSGSDTLEWVTTLILPAGAPFASPADNPCD